MSRPVWPIVSTCEEIQVLFNNSWFSMTSSKILINDFLQNFCNVNVLKGFCKFRVDISINARIKTVQNSGTYPYIYTVAAMLVDKRMPASLFPLYNIKENFPTSLAHNSVFVGTNNFKFGTKTHCLVLYVIPKFVANFL